MASGSKKSRAGTPPETPPELRPWQILVLDAVAASPLGAEVTLGGRTALSAVYLHHRVSEDLDFFAMREIEQHELRPIARALARNKVHVDQRVEGPRRILELSRNDAAVGHVDLSYYPFDPIDRPTRWHKLRVDSLTDMAVNKVQAVLTARSRAIMWTCSSCCGRESNATSGACSRWSGRSSTSAPTH